MNVCMFEYKYLHMDIENVKIVKSACSLDFMPLCDI